MSATASVWASLPVPAVLIDAQGRTAEVNAAAELFLNLSARSLKGGGVEVKRRSESERQVVALEDLLATMKR